MIPLVLILAAVALLALAYRRRASVARPAPVVAPVRPRRQIRTDVPHLLYVYDWAVPQPNDDCYYGISNEPPARDRRHAVDPDDRWWYERTTKVMHPLGWYPNRAAALAAERAIVRKRATEGAHLANTVHNHRARGRRVRVR